MSNKAFEGWWVENYCVPITHVDSADGEDLKTAFEAGQRQGMERAAEIVDGCVVFLSCTKDGHGLSKAIRKEIKP